MSALHVTPCPCHVCTKARAAEEEVTALRARVRALEETQGELLSSLDTWAWLTRFWKRRAA